ncbi:GAA1 [Lepeophtheirus salmonis]|uniref:GPI-anchor transamidase component GPAA1 n=1 Tax=Lepeophtheirus salmonis TaxID=72036 RepID=A0A7R8CR81_LEPSM|nr:GAA1 [Lepeophtheirus salmonis]CAF2900294.1 GAA1 [Lepeophtheirus salmonis]
MGLLTDPSSSNKLIDMLISKYRLLSWVSYLCGFLGLFIMVHPEYSAKTYFSENALLPGLVHGEILAEGEAKRIYNELQEEKNQYSNSVPFPYIEAKFKQAGLEVYRHNFTLHYPLSDKIPSFKGQNIYAILRASRASSTESLVMSVPYRHTYSYDGGTQGSLALLITMASFFRKKNFWAKDIIFLVTENEQLGMQAWLEAYHKTSCGVKGTLDHGELPARAGAIQAAINLEISGEHVTHLNIKTEGLNGQLPNLDLVNLVNRLCLREDVRQMFQGYEDRAQLYSSKGYIRSLKTFLSMMLKQSSGVPSGNHGLFHRFGIEALTIEGIVKEIKTKKKSYHQRKAGFHSLGRIVEGVFRSLNNLLERFHQSIFLLFTSFI